MRRFLIEFALLAAVATAGCKPLVSDLPSKVPETIDAPIIPGDTFVPLKAPIDAFAELCDPENDIDIVTLAFCAPDYVPPTGLADLLVMLKLDFKDRAGENGRNGNPGFAMLGHSSALTARKISTITPTAFVFTAPVVGAWGHESIPEDFTFLAFDPGEHFVEVASNAPGEDGGLNFYLVLFDQACTTAPGGCSNANNLTPNLLTGWQNVRVYEDTSELANTIASCAVCHDPHSTGEPILRMQEIQSPFTHWLSARTEGGSSLLADFHEAHGATEDYGPIPAAMIDKSDPALMAHVITMLGFAEQPNAFPSADIEAEIHAITPTQPAINIPQGESHVWQALYDAAVSGEVIAAPYHDVKVTDPGKLAYMSAAYTRWRTGQTTDLPDIQDVMLDEGLRDMGFAPKQGLDGRTLLQQMCQQCHNADLDPTMTRDRFRVDEIDYMSRDERELAIKRLQMPTSTVFTMPPTLFRTVTPAERALMIEELQKPPKVNLPTGRDLAPVTGIPD